MSMDEVLESWRSKTILHGAFTLAACLGLFFLMIALIRQIRRIEAGLFHSGRTTAEIAAAEERYRVLVDNLPVVTWQSDQRGATSFISRQCRENIRYAPERNLYCRR